MVRLLSRSRKLLFIPLFYLSTALVPQPSFALDVPPLTGPVVDLANVLTPEEQQQIGESLILFQREYGPQLQVLTIPSLEGENIESYSIRVVDQWKLGKKGKDDGVLMLVVPNDRQTRIEVGRGLEGDLPDILAGRIVRDVMIPFFKEGRYDAGIVAGLNAIAGRLGGTLKNAPAFLPAATPHRQNSGLGSLLLFFIFFFIILPRLFGGGRRRQPYRYGRDYYGRRQSGAEGFLTGMILGNLMKSRRNRRDDDWWGGGGGFGGGDGFSGGGGGGFSGGGASGKW